MSTKNYNKRATKNSVMLEYVNRENIKGTTHSQALKAMWK